MSSPRIPDVGDVVADRFELVEQIGQGGFGVIFRATQNRPPPQVALKLMDYQGLGVPPEEAKKRFRREAIMASNIVHPHAVQQLDFGDAGDLFYIAMELVDGETLTDRIARQGPLATPLLLRLAVATLDVLRIAHNKDIVHRDLKPDNIMLCRQGGDDDVPKVLDFGAAKTLHGEHDLTTAGKAVGSPAYMAPEILAGGDPTPASDIYSLGITLGEAIAGKKVVPGNDPIQRARNQMSPDPLDLPGEVTEHPLYPWLAKSIQKPIDRRFSSADEMLRELSELDVILPSDTVDDPEVDTTMPLENTDDDFAAEKTHIVDRPQSSDIAPESPDGDFEAGPTQVVPGEDSADDAGSSGSPPSSSLPSPPNDSTEPFEAPDTSPMETYDTEPVPAPDEPFEAPDTQPMTDATSGSPPPSDVPFDAADTNPLRQDADDVAESDETVSATVSQELLAAARNHAADGDSDPDETVSATVSQELIDATARLPAVDDPSPSERGSAAFDSPHDAPAEKRPPSRQRDTRNSDDRNVADKLSDAPSETTSSLLQDEDYVVPIVFGLSLVVVALATLLYVLFIG